MPTDAMRACAGLKHVIFLGTGARSYMNPEELAELDKASDALTGAEKHFAEVMQSLMKGEMTKMMRQNMVDHVAQCDDPHCEIKKALARADAAEAAAATKLN